MSAAELLSDLTGGGEARAENAVARIATLSPEEAAALHPLLLEVLDSTDADRRWWAARALAALPGIPVTAALMAALADSNPAVRQCAALGLRLRPDPAAIPALVDLLADADALAARLAVDALAEIGAEATPALIDVLQGGSQAARLLAVRALAMIGDQRSIPALFAALNEDSQLMEYWANEGLERMGVGMSFFKPG